MLNTDPPPYRERMSRRGKLGIESMISVKRISTLSRAPPKYPEVAPMVTPDQQTDQRDAEADQK